MALRAGEKATSASEKLRDTPGRSEMVELPSGTVTLLFTDIEGSTLLLKRLRKDYGGLLADHHRLMRSALEQHGGREMDTQGEAFFAVSLARRMQLRRRSPRNAPTRPMAGLTALKCAFGWVSTRPSRSLSATGTSDSACTGPPAFAPLVTAGKCCCLARLLVWSTKTRSPGSRSAISASIS